MLVREWMSTTVITVDPGASISEALELLDAHHISLLPVVRNERLVGMLTNVDIKPFCSDSSPNVSIGPWGSIVSSRIKVEDVMSRAPITVPADFTVEEAAEVLLKNAVPGVVVLDGQNQIVGVLSQTDINRVLVSVTGLWRGGIVFGFMLEDSPGSIKGLTDIMRSYGGRLASILSAYERAPKGYRRVHIRVRGLDRSKLPQLEQELQEKAALMYRIDQRENTRVLYVEREQVRNIARK
jgi:acetoin utilization protein AcuB